MIILVLNSGSSSIKYKLFDISEDSETFLDKGIVERIGEKVPSHKDALSMILSKMDKPIEAVGHRVVHGGDIFRESTIIDNEVIRAIESFNELAPLHNPPSIFTINESRKVLKNVKHVAVFDTSFYQTMPEHVYLYAIPYEYYKKYKIRKYGFHGTSHRYVAIKASSMLNTSLDKLKLVTCHLGNGCSITAIKYGKAIDTSMGFTPLGGLIMGTRSGDLDPTIVSFIMEKEHLDIKEAIDILNKKSGILGISEISNDMREIIKKKDTDKRAKLTMDMFFYRIRKYIGAYIGIMGGVDGVVFTGGIGENQPDLMKDEFGDMVDDKNKILVIPTDEELMIAKDTYKIVKDQHQN
ncbi:MAG: acetate/propionate family kinase [Candidatus Omnitrophota bacterium]